MSACLNSTGKAIVIEFERNGELHQAVRWTTDVEMLERLISMPDYLEELRQRFEATGRFWSMSRPWRVSTCP